MKKKAKPNLGLVENRRARFDFALQDEYIVGIVLNGPEVKAARNNRVSLKGSYVNLKNGELWLTNANFSTIQSQPGESTTFADTRPRKLLAKKREIAAIVAAKNLGLTIVPLSMSTKTNFIKVKIAVAKGKKLYDKRQAIKKRDSERENRNKVKF